MKYTYELFIIILEIFVSSLEKFTYNDYKIQINLIMLSLNMNFVENESKKGHWPQTLKSTLILLDTGFRGLSENHFDKQHILLLEIG